MFPPLESIFFRSYFNMREGFSRLENNEMLSINDRGFREIAKFIISDLKKESPETLNDQSFRIIDDLKKLKVQDIELLEGTGIPKYSPWPSRPGILNQQVTVYFNKALSTHPNIGNTFSIFQYKIEEQLDVEKISGLFAYAFILFAIGTSVQLVNVLVLVRKEITYKSLEEYK